MNIQIVYFSASGITAKAARRLGDLTNSPVFEIEPAVPYTASDLDWTNKTSRSTLEMKKPMAPVDVKTLPDHLDCDTLLIGFPVWWYRAPSIINTFLSKVDTAGMKVAPFITSGGSGMEGVESQLERNFPKIDWKQGLRITPQTTDAQLNAWIESLN